MRLKIIRDATSDEGTLGAGSLDVGYWQFLELPWRNNATGLSCIPAGLYTARAVLSPHLGRVVYRFDNVPGRDAVEMHPANWAGDVTLGWHSDLKGCCAPGEKRAVLVPPDTGKPQQAIVSSAKALDEILAITQGQPLEIEFVWGCPNPEV